ncbi:MAG: hypothetical protein NZR01_02935 [Bryobacteraceae bacterium]|nr:hypothetical protein [Bryobacteraceae bacterium]
MKRWSLWKDRAIVWLYAALIEAAIALIRLIRRRESRGGEGTR